MEKVQINSESQFWAVLSSGICCIERDGARHVVNSAGIGENDAGELCFVVETLADNLCFEGIIALFIFDNARQAQQFLIFEPVEFNEDEVLNSEIIE